MFACMLELCMTFCMGKSKEASGTVFYLWCAAVIASSLLNIGLLSKAVQTLPVGTSYVIWTGVGAIGTVAMGIILFKEPATLPRLFFISTLVVSIIGLKIVSN